MRAWIDLDSERKPEQHPVRAGDAIVYLSVRGAIPYTAILAWAAVRGLDLAVIDLIATVVRTRDADRAEQLASELRSKR